MKHSSGNSLGPVHEMTLLKFLICSNTIFLYKVLNSAEMINLIARFEQEILVWKIKQ